MDRRKNDYIEPLEFDIIETMMVLWRRKRIIILGTGFFTVLAIIIVLLLPRTYKSTGFINTYWPYRDIKEKKVKLKDKTIKEIGYVIKLAESKTKIELINNNDKLIDFVKFNKDKLNFSISQINNLDDLSENNLIKPAYAYKNVKRKLDNKQNFLLGFSLKGLSDSPEKARQKVIMLKEYISCIVLNNEINDYVNINLSFEKGKLLGIDNRISNLRYELQQLKHKEQQIEKLAKDFPILNKGNRIIMSNKDNQTIYLSPLQLQAQLKISIIEKKQLIEKLNWQIIIAKNKIAILQSFSNLINKSDKNFVDMSLINKIYLIFTNHIKVNKNPNEEFKIAINEIKERLTYFKQLKNYVFQLTSFPTIPKTPVAPKRKLIVSLTFVFSLFLFIVLVIFRETWQNKKRR